ncbi:MAG: RluA family pseudouridine synthase [Magnetococcales bacterium]|nr:RluA family pseudouridine synthase [Magnetococcales bacterium]
MFVKPYPDEVQRTQVRLVAVGYQEAGMRLDRFLKEQISHAPLSLLQKLLRTGQVRVDSKRKKGNYRLVEGDKVRIPPITIVPDGVAGTKARKVRCPPGVVEKIARQILYIDDSLLVLDKPSGMAVHGGSGQGWGAIDAVREYLAVGGETSSSLQPELCHRLDLDTSGCLLFGLGKYATRTLTAGFRDGSIDKGYVALVKGRPSPAKGLIDRSLLKGVVRGGERMVVTDESGEGQVARTRYQIEQEFPEASLMNITLETGRTHQIRVHFQSIGHPVAQDHKYGDRDFNQQMKLKGLSRLFLHARSLIFSHPVSNKKVEVLAPLDPVLQVVLDNL